MKNCLLFLGVSALIGFGGVAGAQMPTNKTQDKKVLFTAKAGVNEFSGKMIARPRQESDLLKAGVSEVEAENLRARALELMGLQVIRHYPEVDEYILQVPFGSNENEYAQRLMASGAFQYVEPDWILYPIVNPNDALFPQQWHHTKINAPTAWNHFTGDGSVIIAITDTGVRTTHQDLAGRLVSGANSATGTAIAQTAGGAVEDINGHGTHCAGIAAAIGNNSLGVSGIGWNTKIMPIRVSNQTNGNSSLSALTAGARWAADNGARVISTSYSGFYNSSVQTTGAYIKGTRNGVYCWAAGNDNVNRTTGDHVDVTVVGNSTSSDGKNSSSAYGIAIDLFAPGTDILSTYYSSDSSYVFASGTSMASPLAAGLAALITGTNPSLTAQQVETILYTTCFDLTASPGGVGNDGYWGWGRIDALAAIRKAYNENPIRVTTLTVSTGSVASGNATNLAFRDNSYAVLRRDLTGAWEPLVATFGTISTNKSIARLDVQVENSTTRSGIAQALDLFDTVSNQWVTVDTRMLNLADTSYTVTPTNPTRYRNASTGIIQARVRCVDINNDDLTDWQVRYDFVGFLTAAS